MGSDVKPVLLVSQCYDHLTQWDRLESAATASWATGTGHRATGSVDLLKIWDDTYYEVRLLPQLSVCIQNGGSGHISPRRGICWVV